jgi:hypothetical protein
MSFKLKPTSNNPNPVEFKKEPTQQQQEQTEDEIEILEETIIGQYNHQQIPFRGDNNNEKIKQLESEIKLLLNENNSLNKTIHAKSNEIIDLLKQQKHDGINQLNERIIFNKLESENISLISKINDLNATLQVQSNEIADLKFRLNKYESASNHQMFTHELDQTNINKQSEQTMLNIEPESNNHMSTYESQTDSDPDQSYYETNNQVINKILYKVKVIGS